MNIIYIFFLLCVSVLLTVMIFFFIAIGKRWIGGRRTIGHPNELKGGKNYSTNNNNNINNMTIKHNSSSVHYGSRCGSQCGIQHTDSKWEQRKWRRRRKKWRKLQTTATATKYFTTASGDLFRLDRFLGCFKIQKFSQFHFLFVLFILRMCLISSLIYGFHRLVYIYIYILSA